MNFINFSLQDEVAVTWEIGSLTPLARFAACCYWAGLLEKIGLIDHDTSRRRLLGNNGAERESVKKSGVVERGQNCVPTSEFSQRHERIQK